jgi:C4-dicarboxylate-specific signal transduction histidine kinase
VKWYGTATDIQDRKRAEELQAELAHTNRVSTLGELAASIAHELKQPIAAAMANTQASLRWLNRDQPDLDGARRAAEAIVKDEKSAADIIDHLRSLYKKTPPQRGSVDVDEIIGEMALLLRGEANEYAVSIRTDLAADLPKITADRVQLQQVVMNLMLNGIEAMKETGGVLTVKTGRGECDQVLISVSDTGVGLPACISILRRWRPCRSRPSAPPTSCKPMEKASRSNMLRPRTRTRTSTFILKRPT